MFWKNKYENATCSSFVKATGDKGADKYNTYYYCNRSGYYTNTSRGKHQTNLQGTSKLNAYCTAAIVVTQATKGDKHTMQATYIYKSLWPPFKFRALKAAEVSTGSYCFKVNSGYYISTCH